MVQRKIMVQRTKLHLVSAAKNQRESEHQVLFGLSLFMGFLHNELSTEYH